MQESITDINYKTQEKIIIDAIQEEEEDEDEINYDEINYSEMMCRDEDRIIDYYDYDGCHYEDENDDIHYDYNRYRFKYTSDEESDEEDMNYGDIYI